MRMIWLARGLAVSGLSGVSAVAAHEGPGALVAGRPLLAALAGAAVATAGIGALLATAVSQHSRAARVRRGDLLAARLEPGGAPGAAALLATLLVCQAAAHFSLILFGVAAHGGPPAPLALHALLALLAAAVVIGAERLLGAAGAGLADAIGAALGTLAARHVPPGGGIEGRPRSAATDAAHRGRAPPRTPALGF
jgi:hypothetical protein